MKTTVVAMSITEIVIRLMEVLVVAVLVLIQIAAATPAIVLVARHTFCGHDHLDRHHSETSERSWSWWQ